MSEYSNGETIKQSDNWLRKNAVKIIAVVFWLLIIIAVIVYQGSTGLPARELAASLADQLSNFIAGTWYGPFIYILIYFLRPVILFPASVLTIMAGNLYGLQMGLFWGLIAGTISSVIPFYVGRWFFGGNGEQELDENTNQLERFADVLRNNPFQTILTMRFLFMPYDAVSIFAGSLRVPFWKFFIATFAGNIIGSIPYIALGASVQGNPFTTEVNFDPRIFALAIVMIILSIGFSQLMKRWQNNKVVEAV